MAGCTAIYKIYVSFDSDSNQSVVTQIEEFRPEPVPTPAPPTPAVSQTKTVQGEEVSLLWQPLGSQWDMATNFDFYYQSSNGILLSKEKEKLNKKEKNKSKNKTEKNLGDTDIGELKQLPDKKVKELGGELYMQSAKKDGGKSKANLYWNPKTGDVYVAPNGSSIPQYIDTIPVQ